ncbi:MAG: DUF424 domain-containing protein [Promethearchaeota archaeon]
MKVYIKIHYRNEIETVACCDENLLDQIFIEGTLKIEISSSFFGGELMTMKEAIEILKNASFFNIVGENVIQQAIEHKIISREGVRVINGVPMAMKMIF